MQLTDNHTLDALGRLLVKERAVIEAAKPAKEDKDDKGANPVIHKKILIKSGVHTLQKLTKTQARKIIETTGQFHGYLCGNRVRSAHIADGLKLGVEINETSIKGLDDAVVRFEKSLNEHMQVAGTYAHFYQIVDAEVRNKELRTKYARHSHNT